MGSDFKRSDPERVFEIRNRPMASIGVLKDTLAHLGPYQTLMEVWYIDPGCQNTVSLPATI